MTYTNMTASTIILAGIAISAAVIIWAHLTKRRFNTQSLIITAVLTLLLTGASFMVHHKDTSGTGWRTQYGWPHSVFMTWTAFESEYPTDQSPTQSFSILYLAVNLTVIIPIAAFIALLKPLHSSSSKR